VTKNYFHAYNVLVVSRNVSTYIFNMQIQITITKICKKHIGLYTKNYNLSKRFELVPTYKILKYSIV